MITVAGILLALASCGAQKETVTSNRSLSVRETAAVNVADSTRQMAVMALQSRHSQTGASLTSFTEESQTVPESSATLRTTLTSLRDLPDGASYRASDGRASIELRREGDEVYATGHCDSIERLYRYYLFTSLRQSETVDSLEWELDRSISRQAFLARELAAMKAGQAASSGSPSCSRWPWLIAGCVAGLAGGVLLSKLRYKLPFFSKIQ